MNRKLTVALGATALALGAAPTLFHGSAAADDLDRNDIDRYSKDYEKAHRGGEGGKGGRNSVACLVPLGLSLGAVASTGGDVDQCNARGGDGGSGGAGDVDY